MEEAKYCNLYYKNETLRVRLGTRVLRFRVPTKPLGEQGLRKCALICESIHFLTSHMQFSENTEFAFYLERNGCETWLLKVRYNKDFYDRLLQKSHLFCLVMEHMENLYEKMNGKTDDFFKAQISANNQKLIIDLPGSLNGLYPVLGRAEFLYAKHITSSEVVMLLASLGVLHNLDIN